MLLDQRFLKLSSTKPLGFNNSRLISVTHFYFLLYWAKMGSTKAWKAT